MSVSTYSKCACTACGVHLEYPAEAEGSAITCPQCSQQTTLTKPNPHAQSSEPPIVSLESINAAFTGPVVPTRVSFVYQLGLLVVALAMIALPLIYLALVAAAGWAVYYWATHFTFLLNSGGRGRGWLLMLFLYLTPLFAGIVMVFFMIKPLFARRPDHAQPLALNPGAEPLLFAFVTRICQAVGAPFPKRIDIDCQLNASAGFRRGMLSFLGNDLVLTIGMPLAAGLTLREFAGVLAHEFGHFTQGFGMRLTYIIRSVNGWFARVVYERDSWDVSLEEAAQTDDIKVSIMVGLARFGVWISRADPPRADAHRARDRLLHAPPDGIRRRQLRDQTRRQQRFRIHDAPDARARRHTGASLQGHANLVEQQQAAPGQLLYLLYELLRPHVSIDANAAGGYDGASTHRHLRHSPFQRRPHPTRSTGRRSRGV